MTGLDYIQLIRREKCAEEFDRYIDEFIKVDSRNGGITEHIFNHVVYTRNNEYLLLTVTVHYNPKNDEILVISAEEAILDKEIDDFIRPEMAASKSAEKMKRFIYQKSPK